MDSIARSDNDSQRRARVVAHTNNKRAKAACVSACNNPHARLVMQLLPAYLTRNNRYTIVRAAISSAPASTELAELVLHVEPTTGSTACAVSCALRRDVSSSRKLRVCVSARCAGAMFGEFAMYVREDLDEFDRVFEAHVKREFLPTAPQMIGHGATLAYVLLSMLVYTEHVFASLDDKTIKRTQRGEKHAADVQRVLDAYWAAAAAAATDTCYPFLVRLMPPEFALRIKTVEQLGMFIFQE